MERKEYVKPYFEYIMLWDGDVTTNVFSLSLDNDVEWSEVLSGTSEVVTPTRETITFN